MIFRWLAWLLVLSGLCWASETRADEFRPAYLQIDQLDGSSDRYAVLWKVPALDERRTLAIRPVFPSATTQLSPRISRFAGSATVQQWIVRVPGGLEGKRISFAGRSRTATDVLIRYRSNEGVEQVQRASALTPSIQIEPRAGHIAVAQTYTWIGVEHILGGVDHLLFVFALVLIVKGWRRLLATITAFTIAHSITLALATFEIVRVPSPPVEAVIALSIVFVASEILRDQQGRPGLAARRPWLVAFFFGLLHGLGFAGALAEIGLPHGSVPLGLLFFNFGVEVGQLFFIAMILAVKELAFRLGRSKAVGPKFVRLWLIRLAAWRAYGQ